MKIESIDGGNLRVWLSDEEMHHWSLDQTVPERSRLHRLVRRVVTAAGRRPGRVSAELIPVAGGGVLLLSPRRHPAGKWPGIFRFEDEEALLDLLALWHRGADAIPLCGVYAIRDTYYLAVYPEEKMTDAQMHDAQLLLSALHIGLESIAQAYPDYVRLTVRKVR